MAVIFPNSPIPRNVLLVPDEHYYPKDDFRRCKWLGQFIVDRQPEVIIRLGDCWDMPSLSSYDAGKKEFVFQSVQADIESGHYAETLIFGPMLEMNKQHAKNKKKQYTPLVIKLLGNHEFRVQRLLNYEPRWEGSISMSNFRTRLDLDEHIIEYNDFCILDDVAYAHFFVSGTQGRPYSSAKTMLMKRGFSTVMGHTHVFDYATLTKPTGEMCKALIAGSFHDEKHESFAGKQVDAIWYNGLFYLHNVFKGDFDLEEISIKRLEKMYGGQKLVEAKVA